MASAASESLPSLAIALEREPESAAPVYRQIAAQIREAVEAGQLGGRRSAADDPGAGAPASASTATP